MERSFNCGGRDSQMLEIEKFSIMEVLMMKNGQTVRNSGLWDSAIVACGYISDVELVEDSLFIHSKLLVDIEFDSFVVDLDTLTVLWKFRISDIRSFCTTHSFGQFVIVQHIHLGNSLLSK